VLGGFLLEFDQLDFGTVRGAFESRYGTPDYLMEDYISSVFGRVPSFFMTWDDGTEAKLYLATHSEDGRTKEIYDLAFVGLMSEAFNRQIDADAISHGAVRPEDDT
jgi:hypothetical protein